MMSPDIIGGFSSIPGGGSGSSFFQKITDYIMRTAGSYKRIEILGSDIYFEKDDYGNFVIKITTTGKDLFLDGKRYVYIYVNGQNKGQFLYNLFKLNVDLELLDGETLIKNNSGDTIQSVDSWCQQEVASAHGSKVQKTFVGEEITVPVGQGTGGILSTSFIPGGCIMLFSAGIVTQEDETEEFTFDVCIDGEGDASLGNDIEQFQSTKFNCVEDGDGGWTGPRAISSPTKVKITTSQNVSNNDLKIRIEACILNITEPIN